MAARIEPGRMSMASAHNPMQAGRRLAGAALASVALLSAPAWSLAQAAQAAPSDAASSAQIEEKNDGLDYIASWEVMVEMCSARYPELKAMAHDFWGTRMPKAYREELLASQAER